MSDITLVYFNKHASKKRFLIKFNIPSWFKKKKIKLRTEGNFYNMIKAINEKLIANMILNNERLKAFALRLGKRQWCLLSPLLFNIVLEILPRELVKKKKCTQI